MAACYGPFMDNVSQDHLGLAGGTRAIPGTMIFLDLVELDIVWYLNTSFLRRRWLSERRVALGTCPGQIAALMNRGTLLDQGLRVLFEHSLLNRFLLTADLPHLGRFRGDDPHDIYVRSMIEKTGLDPYDIGLPRDDPGIPLRRSPFFKALVARLSLPARGVFICNPRIYFFIHACLVMGSQMVRLWGWGDVFRQYLAEHREDYLYCEALLRAGEFREQKQLSRLTSLRFLSLWETSADESWLN